MYEKLKEYWFYIVLWVIWIWSLWMYFVKILNEKKWNEFYETFQVSILNQIPKWGKKDTIYKEIENKKINSNFWEYNLNLKEWIYVLNWVNIEKWIVEWKLSYLSDKWLLSDLYNNEETKKDILEKNNLRLYLLPWQDVKFFSKEYNSINWWYIIKWNEIILWNWKKISLKESNDLEKWYVDWSHFWIWFFKNNKEAKNFQEKYFPTIWYVFWWEKTPIVVVWLESQWNITKPSQKNNDWWWQIVEVEDKEYFCTIPNEIKDENNFKYTLENSWNKISTYSKWEEQNYIKIWKHIIDHWYLKRKFEFNCILDWKIQYENKEIIERFCEEWYTYNWNDINPKCNANKNKITFKSNLEQWLVVSNWTENIIFNKEYDITFNEITTLNWNVKSWYSFINSSYSWLENNNIILNENNWLNLQFKNPNNNVEVMYSLLKQCKTKTNIQKWSINFDLWESTIFDSRKDILKTKEYLIQKWKIIWKFNFNCTDEWNLSYQENYTEKCEEWYEFNNDYTNPICIPKKHIVSIWSNIQDSDLEINWDKITWTSLNKKLSYTTQVNTKIEFDENIYYLKNKQIQWISCNDITCSFTMPNNNVSLNYEIWKFCIIPNEIEYNWISFDMWEHKWKKLKESEYVNFSTEKEIQNWKIKVNIVSTCKLDWTLENEITENWDSSTWCNSWYEYNNLKCIWKNWWWSSFNWKVHRADIRNDYTYKDWEYRTWERITFSEPIRPQYWDQHLYSKILWTYVSAKWFSVSERNWRVYISWIVPSDWRLFSDTYYYQNCKEEDVRVYVDDYSSWMKIYTNRLWIIEIWTTVDKKIEKAIKHWKIEWTVWVKCTNSRYEREYSWPTKLYSNSIIYNDYEWKVDISYVKNSNNWKNKKVICDKWYEAKWEECVEITKTITVTGKDLRFYNTSRCSWLWYWRVKTERNSVTVELKWWYWDSNTVRCTFVVKPERNTKVYISWNDLPSSRIRQNDTREVSIESEFRFWNIRDWQRYNINWFEYCEVEKQIQLSWKRYKYSWWNFEKRLKKWNRREYKYEKSYYDSWVSSDTYNIKYECWNTWTLFISSKSQTLYCNSWYRKERKWWAYECVRN